MAEQTEPESIDYARFVIGHISRLQSIQSVRVLLEIEDPGNDEAKTLIRDRAVMQAIWDIRSSISKPLRRLLSDQYELLPKTRTYLESFYPNYSSWDRPFRDDGIKWNDTCFGMWYHNAFDHAITYHITRGWGLSGAYVNEGGPYDYNDKKHGEKNDPSVWLATVEALSLQNVIPPESIPDNVIGEWGQCKSDIREKAKGLLNQAIENSKDR